jgi:ABC-2 type transport system permease protein
MRNVLSICKREILAFFVSPIAYFVVTGFVLLAGFFFFGLLGNFNAWLARFAAMPYRGAMEAPNLNQWVVEGFYHTLIVVLVFLVPLLTMRLIADERRTGTFELLVTSPVSVGEIVLGKFLGVAFVIFVMITLVSLFPLILYAFGNPEVPPILSGYLGLLLCSLSFASVGMAVSSFTENQIVAGISGMVTLLLLYVLHSFAEPLGGVWADVAAYISPAMQVQDPIKGVITIKSAVYFISLITLGLFLAQRALEAYRWR